MRIGLLADIHANADALRAVLDDARRRSVDELLIAGDFVGYYYAPDRVLQLLDDWSWTGVAGNHEALLAQWLRGEERDALAATYGTGFAEAERQLASSSIERLGRLPACWQGAVGNRQVLLCHGTPWDPGEYVYPNDDGGRLERMAANGEDLVVYGHTHYPVIASFGATVVVNPGSVGQPRDRNPDAAWGIWDTASNSVVLARTPYDNSHLLVECRTRDPDMAYLTDVLTRR